MGEAASADMIYTIWGIGAVAVGISFSVHQVYRSQQDVHQKDQRRGQSTGIR